MKYLFFVLTVILVACTNNEILNVEISPTAEQDSVKDLVIQQPSIYKLVLSSWDKEGADFFILSSDELETTFAKSVPNEMTELRDSLKKYSKYGGNIQLLSDDESGGTYVFVDPVIPDNISEYIEGFKWVTIDKDYYEKSRKYDLWGDYIDAFFVYKINLSDSELDFLKANPVDSIGLSRDSYKHPQPSFDKPMDTTYFLRNFPNKKLPIKSNWTRKSLYYSGSLYYNSGFYQGAFSDFLVSLDGHNLSQINLDSNYHYFFKKLTESDKSIQLGVKYLGKKIHLSYDELVSLDSKLGTSYAKDWQSWKHPPRSPVKTYETPCEGYKDCSYEVRQMMEGAGWELAGDVIYYGEGVHYAVGAKPMETGVKEIYYTMDCNCEPLEVSVE